MGSQNFEYHPLESKFSTKENLLDPKELRRQDHMMVDFIAEYYENVEKYPVLSQVQPGYLKALLPKSAPYHPDHIETILKDVQHHIVPGLMHTQSPNFFAYFPINGSGFLGEMLVTEFNSTRLNWVTSPAAIELENVVIDWLGKTLCLPKSFLFSGGAGGGVLLGNTCEAVLCPSVAARDQMLRRIGQDNIGKLVVYCSNQTHSVFQKACHIAGIHPSNLHVIKTTISSAFALSPDLLRSTICKNVEDGLIPLYLCATVGMTSTTTVDPLVPLCDVAKDYGIWVHVDAAYARSLCICPEFHHFIDGIEGANSFSFNPHKLLFTMLDCSCLWVKDPSH